MITTTIPQFAGSFAIEIDNGLYCAMRGPQSMYKSNGKAAEFKTLSGAVKFFASQGIHPVTEEVTEVEEIVVAKPIVEIEEEVKVEPIIAKITKIAAKYSENVRYSATVFTLDGYKFIGKGENLTESEVRAQLTQSFPSAIVAANDTEFTKLIEEAVNAIAG